MSALPCSLINRLRERLSVDTLLCARWASPSLSLSLRAAAISSTFVVCRANPLASVHVFSSCICHEVPRWFCLCRRAAAQRNVTEHFCEFNGLSHLDAIEYNPQCRRCKIRRIDDKVKAHVIGCFGTMMHNSTAGFIDPI